LQVQSLGGKHTAQKSTPILGTKNEDSRWRSYVRYAESSHVASFFFLNLSTSLRRKRRGDEGFSGDAVKVIVIRQPWAWLIVNGFKDIENRSWATRYRGPLLIQASAHRLSKEEMQEHRTYARRRKVELPEEFDLGGIVGMVRLEDCVYKSRSK
jgi:hypothetical protein